MAIRAVSLDLFDTLVDLGIGAAARSSAPQLHRVIAEHADVGLEAFEDAIRSVDRELRKPLYAEGVELSTEQRFARIAERLGIEVPGLVDNLARTHMGVLRDQMAAPPHHGDVLDALRARTRVAVCSNFTDSVTARGVLSDYGLMPHLDAVVISVEVGIRKPRREIFDAVVEALEIPPEETLHVGDNLKADVAGAAAVGMRTAWITRRVDEPERALAASPGPEPEFVVSDLRELVPLVENG